MAVEDEFFTDSYPTRATEKESFIGAASKEPKVRKVAFKNHKKSNDS
jgi:hypothetical protein